MRKKYQVFISSTFIDLVEERQWAVQAILNAGHIPAGMELFAASDTDQWNDIKNWIDESDIYMLILGGRYGSIDPESKKSYTHKEYEYALQNNKPLFALILNDAALQDKASKDMTFIERTKDYEDFKRIVKSKMIREINGKDAIMLQTILAINNLEKNRSEGIVGWVKADELENRSESKETIKKLIDEAEIIRKENSNMKLEIVSLNEKLSTLRTDPKSRDLEKLVNILKMKYTSFDSERNSNLLDYLIANIKTFTGPLKNPEYEMYGNDNPKDHANYKLACEYFSLGLMERDKSGVVMSLNQKGIDLITYAQSQYL
jgi:hypothetical protein